MKKTETEALKISVVVLNWNGREDTLRCLESLKGVDYPNWEVLVVDNGSEDGSVAAILKGYPEITVMEAGRNLGYAGGNNLGIEEAVRRGSEFVLLLNNDTTVAPDILRAFARAAEEYRDAGVFGAKIYLFNEPGRLWYAGGRWRTDGKVAEHEGLGTIDNEVDFERIRDTDYACGCAMFIRSSALSIVGMLEEEFFLVFEEADWCLRATKAGFRCLFVPDAKVWHRVSASFGGPGSILYEYFLLRNRLLWAERHLTLRRRMAVWAHTFGILCPPLGVLGALWLFICGRWSARQAYWEARARAQAWLEGIREPRLRMVRRVRWRAFCDYLLRHFGNCPTWVRTIATIDRHSRRS